MIQVDTHCDAEMIERLEGVGNLLLPADYDAEDLEVGTEVMLCNRDALGDLEEYARAVVTGEAEIIDLNTLFDMADTFMIVPKESMTAEMDVEKFAVENLPDDSQYLTLAIVVIEEFEDD